MQSLEQVYKRLQQIKKERREIQKMLKDELAQNERYAEIQEEMKALREEKKGIEQEVMADNDASRLDELKADIGTDTELLADIALNMYVENKQVEIVDENDQVWYPQFRVTFKNAQTKTQEE